MHGLKKDLIKMANYRFMNHVAVLEDFRALTKEPRKLKDCVFRLQSVVNREDILRTKIMQQVSTTVETDNMLDEQFGVEIKYGESIQVREKKKKEQSFFERRLS
jgi:hypothetical protein